MNRLIERLLRWSLGDLDARILLSELQEPYNHRINSEGKAAANRWRRGEILRAVMLAASIRIRKESEPDGSVGRSTGRGSSISETLRSVLRDVQFGLRTLRKRPLFTAIAVGTLGLGIGASSAIFSVVEAVLLRPLPYASPGELVQAWETFPDWLDNPQLASDWDKIYMAWPDYERWRDGQTVFQGVALYGSTVMTLTGLGTPERIQVGTASASLLSVLGVRPILGREFLPGDDGRNAERVALLAYSTWRDRFGGDPDMLGRTISLNDQPFTVVGVLPLEYRVRGLGIFGGSGDYPVWIPIGANGARLRANDHSYDAVARLKRDVTLAQALPETEMLLRGERSAAEIGARLASRDELEDAGLRGPLYLLLVASIVLLLIACGNVAVLLIGEFSGRQHEMATRMAVGAGGGRLIRQLLTESVLLGVAGSVVGVSLALAGTGLLVGLAPPVPRLEQVGVNGAVLLFGTCAGAVSGLLFGMAPAWGVLRGKIRLSLLGDRGADGAGGSLLSFSVVTGEIGLTVILLVSAGLLGRSLSSLLAVDPGFESDKLAQISVRLPYGRYSGTDLRLSIYEQMAAELSAVPGVTTVSGTTSLPFMGYPSLVSFGIEGRAEPEGGSRHASPKMVLPGFTGAMGIPLLAGRTISETDRAELANVAVVSESMARSFWPGESPLGARILFGDTLTVVGIVGDVLHESMDAEYVPTIYVPFALEPRTSLTFIVRSGLDSSPLLSQLRQAIWAVDADAPVTRVSFVDDLIVSSARNERFRTILMLAFSLCAIVLAGAGVFGVTARSVALRKREMGIRLALGAQGRELIRLALGRTLTAGTFGVGLGLVGALVVCRLFARFLFGVPSWDPVTYLTVATILLGLSLFASWLPARQASRVDPVQALRRE